MKVFASTIAITAVIAQRPDDTEALTAGDGSRGFDYDSFDSYDLSSFDSSYGFDGGYDYNLGAYDATYDVADAAPVGAGRDTAVAADEAEDDEKAKGERYFFTVPPAPPVITTTGTVVTVPSTTACWKCDAMTYATCASGGHYQACPLGDKDCCFVEIREQYQQLQQLCTGCKDKTACEDNKLENFNPSGNTNGEHVDQCRSDYRLQRMGKRENNQSVCRQCFRTCDPSANAGAFCFGSISGNTGTSIAFKLKTNNANYPWTTAHTTADFVGLGIPTRYAADSGSGTISADIAAFTAGTLNVYFGNAVDGKVDPSNGDNTGDVNTEMVFWGLHGASADWWASDLKAKQDSLEALNNIGATAGSF